MIDFKSAVIGSLAVGAVLVAQPGSAAQTAVGYPVNGDIAAGSPIGPIGTPWGVIKLAVGKDGNYYGINDAVQTGTAAEQISLIEVTPDGAYSSLYTYAANDGSRPMSLIASADGSLYGANYSGGMNDFGTLFKYSAGQYTVLHDFSGFGPDNGGPSCLSQGADGAMYGVTDLGNANGGYGTIFKLASDGTFKTIYLFSNGIEQRGCPVVLADGSMYGVVMLSIVNSSASESYTSGIYRLTPDGTFTVLQQFSYTTQKRSNRSTGTSVDFWGTLAVGADGNIYGTELQYSNTVQPTGKLYQLSPSGAFKIVANSVAPTSQLLAGKDGSIYSYEVAFNTLYQYSPPSGAGTSFTQSVLYSTASSVWTGLSPTQPAAWFADGFNSLAVVPDADGNLIMSGQSSANASMIDKIVLAGDMAGSAVVTPSRITAGASATINWKFTGASSCDLVGDAPDASAVGAKPAKGSLTVTPSTTSYLYRFAMQCRDSKGGFIRVPLKLAVTP